MEKTSRTYAVDGDVVRATITTLKPELNAAFADGGDAGELFVSLSRLDSYQKKRVAPNKRVVARVTRNAEGTKRPRCTLEVSFLSANFKIILDGTALAGPKLPCKSEILLSKNLDEDSAHRLRMWTEHTLSSTGIEGLHGRVIIIVRSQAAALDYQEFAMQLDKQIESALQFQDVARAGSHPCVLMREQPAEKPRADLTEKREDSLLISDDQEPLEGEDVSQLKKVYSLPSGGNVVVEKTDALWAIDVNTAVTRPTKERTVFQITNDEATVAIADAIRELELYGLIAIDFAGNAEEAELKRWIDEISLNLGSPDDLYANADVRLSMALLARGKK